MKNETTHYTIADLLYNFSIYNFICLGQKGHAIVAEVAFNFLDPAKRKVLTEYLDGMTIQDATNWMNEIKSDKTYDYLRKLHYINAERGQKITLNNEENSIGALTKTIEELKNYKALTKAEVKIKLCILFHLVGDLHQPLHVGYGEDKGGNNYQINFYGRGTNLHSFYDSGILEYKNLTLPQCIKAKSYIKEELLQVEKIDVVEWANQTISIT
ncbi:S1/P1 nuclease [Flavobacterium sp.]|uniref:S1/P1 nuclease n=1 Tax=Flavobacterium sp. TaxID=239 RepID=UPI0037514C99